MTIHELNIKDMAARQEQLTAQWHEQIILTPWEPLYKAVEANHLANFHLWHAEDSARRSDVSDAYIRQVKQKIDGHNQNRNDAMERIDDWFAHQLAPKGEVDAPLHSETPGQIIDRLSILALKSYHMNEEASRESADAEHRQKCTIKAQTLEQQRADLIECLCVLVNQLCAEQRRFKVYRQFKMYNDPTLNPQIYQCK